MRGIRDRGLPGQRLFLRAFFGSPEFGLMGERQEDLAWPPPLSFCSPNSR